jgi:hypothetical protein
VAVKLGSHPRLEREVTKAAAYVAEINWHTSFGVEPGEGACIPIAVFTAAFLREAGIGARPVEAGARFTDPFSARYAEVGNEEESPLGARDEKGLPFIGHMVVQVPTFQAVFDLSLPTQRDFITMRNLGGPVDVLVGEVDHRKGQVGFKSSYGRGTVHYRIYPRRDGWKHRAWPWASLIDAGARAYRGEDEFAVVNPAEYVIEER